MVETPDYDINLDTITSYPSGTIEREYLELGGTIYWILVYNPTPEPITVHFKGERSPDGEGDYKDFEATGYGIDGSKPGISYFPDLTFIISEPL